MGDNFVVLLLEMSKCPLLAMSHPSKILKGALLYEKCTMPLPMAVYPSFVTLVYI